MTTLIEVAVTLKGDTLYIHPDHIVSAVPTKSGVTLTLSTPVPMPPLLTTRRTDITVSYQDWARLLTVLTTIERPRPPAPPPT